MLFTDLLFKLGGNANGNVVPTPAPGTNFRFYWNTPFMLSPHNPSIVWLGGNRLFKSYNQGDTWVASADLTRNIDRNTVAMMGVPGDRTQLSKNDGVVFRFGSSAEEVREDFEAGRLSVALDLLPAGSPECHGGATLRS